MSVKKTVDVADILILNQEFAQFASEQSLTGGTKFRANGIRKQVIEHLESVNELQIEIIKKHGGYEKKNGVFQIDHEIDDPNNAGAKIPNPQFAEYSKEWGEVLKEEKTIEYTPIEIAKIDDKVLKGNYNLLFDFCVE